MNILIQILSTAFWFLVILIPLVAIHEFGHLLMSKLVGVKVIEYGIGIPPRAIARRWKGIIWSLNWLPFGGFAKIYGDHDALDEAQDNLKSDPQKSRETYQELRMGEIISSGDLEYFLKDNNLEFSEEWISFAKTKGQLTEKDLETYKPQINQLKTLIDWEYDTVINAKDAFCRVPWWKQTVILLGGVTFNMITAVVLFFIMFGIISTPPVPVLSGDIKLIEEQAEITYKSENIKVLRVIPDTAASRSGLSSGDDLISFGGKDLKQIQDFNEFADLIQNQNSKNVSIVYRDNDTGETITKEIELDEKDGKYFLGLRSEDIGYFVRYRFTNPLNALGKAFQTSGSIFLLNFQYLGDIITSPFTRNYQSVENVGGPIAVGSVGAFIFEYQGVSGIINIIAVISVALAAFNLLPIPALDGGRLVIITLNRIMGRRNKRLEAVVIGLTFIVMLALAGVVAFWDIYRIASGKGFGM